MQLQALLRTVTPTLDGDVLYALARGDGEFTISALNRTLADGSNEGIRLVLRRLMEQGVVRRREVGTGHSYWLNREHLAAPAIIALATLSDQFRSRIADRVEKWSHTAVFVGLFGSAATGEMQPWSDLDLVLVCSDRVTDAWHDQVDQLAQDVTAWTGNDARPLVYEEAEIRGRASTESVLRDIARSAITIWGDRSAFEHLIGAR